MSNMFKLKFINICQIVVVCLFVFIFIVWGYFIINKNRDFDRITEIGTVNSTFVYLRLYETYVFTGCAVEEDVNWLSTNQLIVGSEENQLILSYKCDYNLVNYVNKKEDPRTLYSSVFLKKGEQNMKAKVEFLLYEKEEIGELEIKDKIITLVNEN